MMMIMRMIIITMMKKLTSSSSATSSFLLHCQPHILMFTLTTASHAVFSFGVVPLHKCTFLPTPRGDFVANPPPQTWQKQNHTLPGKLKSYKHHYEGKHRDGFVNWRDALRHLTQIRLEITYHTATETRVYKYKN